jgi:diamine N-acetyltransferase
MATEARSGPVYLRALDAGDLDRCHRWHNDPELYATLVSAFRHVSRAAEEEWLRRNIAYSTGHVALAICLATNDEHIGNVYLRDIDWQASHADVGMFIGEPAHRGKGYGGTAMRLLIRHGFDDLGLHRLQILVLADHPAVRLYEKCGFRVEGTLRDHAFKGGRFCDLAVMGLLTPGSAPRPRDERHA